jgi:hypothetical protein
MTSAIILALALAALGHFGMFLWRLGIIALAAEPLSDRIFAAAPDNSLDEKGFQALSSLNEICPELEGCGRGLRLVRGYHSCIQALDRLAGILLPCATRWTQQELTLCARYLAVEIDHRLARNQACFAALRSY